MDSDYEVVFEGSPLALHMQECGIEDSMEKKEEIDNKANSLLQRMWETLKSVGYVWTKKPVVDYYRCLSLQAIIDCNILERNDVEYCIAGALFDSKSYRVPSKIGLIGRGLWDSMITCIPSAAILAIQLPMKTKIPMLCIPPVILIWHWRSLFVCRREYKKLISFLKKLQQYNDLLKKSVNFIGENNMINHGYVMAKNKNMIWKLESSQILELSRRSQSLLPGLRIAVLDTSTRLAVAYSNATEEQKSKDPLPCNLDHPALYMPEFSMEDRRSLEELHGDTDGPRLPSLRLLKASLDILQLKQSECLRRFASDLICGQYTGTLKITIGKPLDKEVMACIQEVFLALKLHRSFLEINKCKIKLLNKDKPLNDQTDLYNYFHSCLSHLREAVISSNGIDQYFEDWSSESEVFYGEIEEGLTKMLHHIQSSEFCLSKAILFMSRVKANRSSAVSQVLLPKVNIDTVDLVRDAGPKVVISDSPKDEIFEIITHDDIKENESSTTFEEICFDEMDRESTTMLMKELKSVIKVKADDWEEREKLLRQRLTGAAEISEQIAVTNQPSVIGRNSDPLDSRSLSLLEDEEMVERESIFNRTELYGAEARHIAIDSPSHILPSEDGNLNRFCNESVSLSRMASDAAAANMSSLYEVQNQGLGLDVVGNLAAEAVAKAHSAGLPLLEEDLFEFSGDSNE